MSKNWRELPLHILRLEYAGNLELLKHYEALNAELLEACEQALLLPGYVAELYSDATSGRRFHIAESEVNEIVVALRTAIAKAKGG